MIPHPTIARLVKNHAKFNCKKIIREKDINKKGEEAGKKDKEKGRMKYENIKEFLKEESSVECYLEKMHVNFIGIK